MRTTIAAAIGAVTLSLALTACCHPAENVLEQLTEDQIGADVDINADGNGGVKVETEGGSYAVGNNVQLPDNFPKDVPHPDEAKLASVFDASGTYMLMFDDISKSEVDAGK